MKLTQKLINSLPKTEIDTEVLAVRQQHRDEEKLVEQILADSMEQKKGSILTKREAEVLWHLFNFQTAEHTTIRSLSLELGISENRILNLRAAALRKLLNRSSIETLKKLKEIYGDVE